MIKIVIQKLGQTIEGGARSIMRSMATGAQERVVPSAAELRRTRELFNVIDDRLAVSLKGVTEGMARIEAQVTKLENKMDHFASKASMQEGFQHLETKFKYYVLTGAAGIAVTGVTIASRTGTSFFESPRHGTAAPETSAATPMVERSTP